MRFNQFKIGLLFTILLMTGTSGYGAVAQICDSEVCRPFTYFDGQSVMDKLTEMFQQNTNQILLCQADSATKQCLNQPLMFNGQTNMMAVDFQIPFMRILQKERLQEGFSFLLNYQVRANDKYPTCASSVSSLTVSSQGELSLLSPAFECRATELGDTSLSFQFQIDYINFETGWIGAYYQTVSSGDVSAQGTAYVMMQLSSERSIPLKRHQSSHNNRYDYDEVPASSPETMTRETGKLVDWDKENIKNNWNSFTEKFLKILYLEPIE